MKRFIMSKILRPQWIVNEYGEFGVRILGINMYYYKWDTPLFYGRGGIGEPNWRIAYKREFGETILSPFGRFSGELPPAREGVSGNK